MKFMKKKTPLMKGLERELMSYFLKQIKEVRGLTSALETTAGINGKWLNPDKPYDFGTSKMLKIWFVQSLYFTDEEFIARILELKNLCIKFCEENGYLTKTGHVRMTAEIIYRFITGENDFKESQL